MARPSALARRRAPQQHERREAVVGHSAYARTRATATSSTRNVVGGDAGAAAATARGVVVVPEHLERTGGDQSPRRAAAHLVLAVVGRAGSGSGGSSHALAYHIITLCLQQPLAHAARPWSHTCFEASTRSLPARSRAALAGAKVLAVMPGQLAGPHRLRGGGAASKLVNASPSYTASAASSSARSPPQRAEHRLRRRRPKVGEVVLADARPRRVAQALRREVPSSPRGRSRGARRTPTSCRPSRTPACRFA